jgi:predicted acyl esterase
MGYANVGWGGILRRRGAAGVIRRLELDLAAGAARLRAGDRLRLLVSSSSFPRWDRPSHTDVEPGLAAEDQVRPARQTLHHDRARPSHVSVTSVERAGEMTGPAGWRPAGPFAREER